MVIGRRWSNLYRVDSGSRVYTRTVRRSEVMRSSLWIVLDTIYKCTGRPQYCNYKLARFTVDDTYAYCYMYKQFSTAGYIF